MTTIRVMKLVLVNFKGQKHLEVNFNPDVTYITGDNSTGKTTIMDAFLWVLFGKDSQNRADFNIKTLDSEGKAIHKLEHEVTAVIDVDGIQTTFRRCYKENWVKKRGAVEPVMDGHSVDYFVDDVPLGKREYDRRVSDICPEALFRQITNPAYFPSLKMQDQRVMLFDIAGNITNEDVLKTLVTDENKDVYAPLVEALNSRKSLDDFKKQTVSQKNLIKKEVSDIPGRIEENNRNMPEAQDWEAIRAQISVKKAQIQDYDAQIADFSKAAENVSAHKSSLRTQINDKLNRIDVLKREVRKAANEEYETWYLLLQDKKGELSRAESKVNSLSGTIEYQKKEVNVLHQQKQELLTVYRQLQSEEFSINEDELVCPTCGRQFEGDEYISRLEQMKSGFNNRKTTKIEANVNEGKRLAGRISKAESLISETEQKLSETVKLKDDLQREIEQMENHKPEQVRLEDTEKLLSENAEYQSLQKQITEWKEDLNKSYSVTDTSDLMSKKNALQLEIDSLNRELAKEDQIIRTTKRNEELEQQLRSMQQEIADCEQIEMSILEFMKAKVSMVEQRINSTFSYVKFKMFDKQVDGTEYDTCECMVDGTPYSDLNTAKKMNAGIDIINALCRAKGVTAPIFLDNRESVSELIPCPSQLINLMVQRGSKLTIN
ncbi:ATP-binding protein [Parabacteroides sp.]|uniref:ATP-binding protein n=1 Tax=Parabacteroides sp. TaxID=1869337 RepID=UPI001D701FF1|nr:ATP-binding protein [Parabacteroides sp.]MBS5485510.1 AAA family ATPase [Parabacteroides sp.]